MVRAIVLAAALLLAVMPLPAHAWGFEAHKFIMDRAIALLPAELKPLFESRRAALVERAIDPDTWIIAGWQDEAPNHFLDMDSEGMGPYPFAGLPRDYTAALARFGAARMRDVGTLPWRMEEIYGSLRRAFESYGRRGAFGQNDIVFFSAWLAHYVSDGHVPLHSVSNYDGQLTQQWGLHARWESAMFERYRDRLTIAPKPLAPIKDARAFMFERLLEGTQLVPALLQSDLKAIRDGDAYDDAYYETFFAANKAVMERRINESVAGVAAAIAGAWEAAGRPAVPLNPSSPPQRRRRQ